MKTGAEPRPGSKEPAILDQTSELWRNSEILLTSSPTFANGTIYLVNKVGELCAIDPKTGAVNWRHKLGADQLHASPIYADGKLYIPMRYDGFYVIKPGEKAAEVLSHTTLEGEALGAPAVWNGKIYVHTTKKLYCFGSKSGSKQLPAEPQAATAPVAGEPTQIQIVPSEVALRPGEKQTFRLRALDANGLFVKDLSGGEWKKFVPATAKVKSEMDAEFDAKWRFGGEARREAIRRLMGTDRRWLEGLHARPGAAESYRMRRTSKRSSQPSRRKVRPA